MTTRQHSSFAIVFILGLLAMLMPLSIDMYLPALPVISAQFGVPAGSTQMTLSTYILGFALGQLIYGPMADSFGRKPVVLGGTLVFAAAAVACALAQTIDQLIVMRFFHGLAAAAASVVINALMRDIYPKEEFSRMMSFVMLVTTIAPLMAPIVGGWVLVWLSWHYIFWILAVAAILASAMIFFLIKETLPPERRQPFHIRTTIGNFAALFRHKRVLGYMLASGFSFAGMFSFLSAGPFVYIEINRVMEERSRAFAAYLQQGLGLKKGDRVALMMPNLLQYPVALFGILRAGMIVVNVNPLYTPRELEHQLNDSGASAIVIVSNFAHTLEKVVDKTAVQHVILTRMGDQLSTAKGTVVNFVVKYIKRLVPKYHLPDAISFRSALHNGYRMQYVKPELVPEDLAFLQYTGGTTGVAKGAMLTHRNMLANLEQVNATYGPLLHPGKELVVTALPLYHIFALTINCLLFIELGGQNLLITNPRDIPGLVKELAKYPFTAITGVNTLFNALLNNKEFQQLDFSSLHLSAGGGMPVQQVVAERWVKLTGQYLLEGYGLTECAPLVSVNPYDIDYHSGSIGLPVPSTEAKLVDDDDNEVPPGQPGELCVKGPQVMLGYWQRPDATDEIIKNGWLHTGDIAVMDEEGFLRIVDRKKDMILVSGFNVYPNEIEDVVMQHPGVQEVAAVGVPSGSSGEAVKIFVVKKDPSLTEESLVTFCRRQLTGYKVPKLVEFRDELPKSNVGKILRRELRDEARGKVDNKA